MFPAKFVNVGQEECGLECVPKCIQGAKLDFERKID